MYKVFASATSISGDLLVNYSYDFDAALEVMNQGIIRPLQEKQRWLKAKYPGAVVRVLAPLIVPLSDEIPVGVEVMLLNSGKLKIETMAVPLGSVKLIEHQIDPGAKSVLDVATVEFRVLNAPVLEDRLGSLKVDCISGVAKRMAFTVPANGSRPLPLGRYRVFTSNGRPKISPSQFEVHAGTNSVDFELESGQVPCDLAVYADFGRVDTELALEWSVANGAKGQMYGGRISELWLPAGEEVELHLTIPGFGKVEASTSVPADASRIHLIEVRL
jgi:uncharacterized cupredoxin-like copper-binding protein